MASREPDAREDFEPKPQRSSTGTPRTSMRGRPASEIAKRNLIWSIVAEHVGFSVWSIWSVMVLFMPQDVYGIDAAGKFYLVAVPTLVGAVHAHPVHHRARQVRRPQLDDRQRAAAADPDGADAVLDEAPRHVVHDVHDRGGVRRLRRRQLRVVDDQHQRVLPAAAQGLGARPERRRRQHRRAGHPADRPAGDRDRRQHRARNRLRHLPCR